MEVRARAMCRVDGVGGQGGGDGEGDGKGVVNANGYRWQRQCVIINGQKTDSLL